MSSFRPIRDTSICWLLIILIWKEAATVWTGMIRLCGRKPYPQLHDLINSFLPTWASREASWLGLCTKLSRFRVSDREGMRKAPAKSRSSRPQSCCDVLLSLVGCQSFCLLDGRRENGRSDSLWPWHSLPQLSRNTTRYSKVYPGLWLDHEGPQTAVCCAPSPTRRGNRSSKRAKES